MTEREVDRIVALMVAKAGLYPDQSDVETIVRSVVTDALLIADGSLSVEMFEEAQK